MSYIKVEREKNQVLRLKESGNYMLKKKLTKRELAKKSNLEKMKKLKKLNETLKLANLPGINLGQKKIEIMFKRGNHTDDLVIRNHRLSVHGFKSYLDYLDSILWEKTRNQYFKSHPHICPCCYYPSESIILHHLSYDRVVAEDIDKDFLPLCPNHHDILHKFLRLYNLSVINSLTILRYINRKSIELWTEIMNKYGLMYIELEDAA